jgi:hypothetical protein
LAKVSSALGSFFVFYLYLSFSPFTKAGMGNDAPLPPSELLEIVSFRNQDLDNYSQFRSLVLSSFTLPGLAAGFVPQGIANIPGSPALIVSGYHADSKLSVVYLIDLNAQKPLRVAYLTSGGIPQKRHAGGVAVTGDHFWIPGNGSLFRFPLYELLSHEASDRLHIEMDVEITGIESRGSHLSAWGDYLIMGDFGSRRPQHGPVSHHRSPKDSRLLYRSLVFKIDRLSNMPVDVDRPSLIIHHDDQVQGLAMGLNGLVVTSRSWGDNHSRFEFHRIPLEDNWIKYSSRSPYRKGDLAEDLIPSISLSRDNRLITIFGPPGSEGIALVGNKAMTLFEGGAYPYRSRWKTLEDRVFEFTVQLEHLEQVETDVPHRKGILDWIKGFFN